MNESPTGRKQSITPPRSPLDHVAWGGHSRETDQADLVAARPSTLALDAHVSDGVWVQWKKKDQREYGRFAWRVPRVNGHQKLTHFGALPGFGWVRTAHEGSKKCRGVDRLSDPLIFLDKSMGGGNLSRVWGVEAR